MAIKAIINNFSEKELSCRCGCNKLNYDDNFLIRLQAFRLIINQALIVTSGCRCQTHNKKVGGVTTSLHECTTKKASACDITGKNIKNIFEQAKASKLFNEVIYYQKKNIIHLGYDPNQKGNYFAVK